MLNDWHYGVKCEMSHALRQQRGKSMSARATVEGKTRLVDVRFLWLQPAMQEGRVKLFSVPTCEDLSETFTKSQSQPDAHRCYRCMIFHRIL